MNPPSFADVIAACREPEWPTAAEVAACIASGRAMNAHQQTPAGKPAAKKQRQTATLLTALEG